MDNLPKHIAIICDGNRRWARAHFVPSLIGHQKGFEAFLKVSKHLRARGVHTLTAWGFSTENWDRSTEEINYLMKLFERIFDDMIEDIIADKVRVVHLGRKDRLPQSLLKKIISTEERTKDFTNHVFNVGLDYGGQDEIVRAVRKIKDDPKASERVNAEVFSSYLDTGNQPHPNPDMIIRTGGEHRLSGFLLWQIAYAELFFPKETLPDLTPTLVDQLLEEYSTRHRRFGK
ncbi:MAG: polyprenyl diphosphate synthase [Microgenomates group bacterium]